MMENGKQGNVKVSVLLLGKMEPTSLVNGRMTNDMKEK